MGGRIRIFTTQRAIRRSSTTTKMNRRRSGTQLDDTYLFEYGLKRSCAVAERERKRQIGVCILLSIGLVARLRSFNAVSGFPVALLVFICNKIFFVDFCGAFLSAGSPSGRFFWAVWANTFACVLSLSTSHKHAVCGESGGWPQGILKKVVSPCHWCSNSAFRDCCARAALCSCLSCR